MSFTDLKPFIALSEHTNLHQAARQLLVTPQYLSRYISALEQQYQVTLFYRTPQLRLTYEGELLLEAAKDISFYERNFKSELQDLSVIDEKELRLGYSNESIRFLFPKLLSNYRAIYGNTKVSIIACSEEQYSAMLEDGQIDLFFGTNLEERARIEYYPLPMEKAYLLVSDRLLRRSFPNDYPLCAERFRNGISTEELCGFPLLENVSEWFFFQEIEKSAAVRGYRLQYAFSSGCTEALIGLCRKGIGALPCTARYLSVLTNSNSDMDAFIYSFPIKDMSIYYHLDIAYAKERRLARHITTFMHCAAGLYQAVSSSMEEGEN